MRHRREIEEHLKDGTTEADAKAKFAGWLEMYAEATAIIIHQAKKRAGASFKSVLLDVTDAAALAAEGAVAKRITISNSAAHRG